MSLSESPESPECLVSSLYSAQLAIKVCCPPKLLYLAVSLHKSPPVGSSLVDSILTDGTFVPRAVTRDASSESALKLKAQGAEVVQADLSDIESLKKAIAGSEGVFGVSPWSMIANVFCSQTLRLPTPFPGKRYKRN